MVMKTKLTEMLGIKHPIVQGGMHYVGYAEMAAAVSNAGGLGLITALTMPTPEDLRAEIRKCKTMTDKPFGVNLTLLPSIVPPDYDGYFRVVVEEGIKVVETAGNNPKKYMPLLKENGIKVIHKCVAIRHAKSAVASGVDCLSIDGFECAGHPGDDDVGNMVLLAIAARQIGIPYIASGGIGDGRQLAAALALGAEGINMGTRFMATKEAPIHQNIKQALVDGNELSTTHVFRSLKNTERTFKNSTSMKVVEIEKEHPGDFSKIAHLVKGAGYKKSFQETGDIDDSVWSAGIVMGLINDVPSCEELVNRVMAEAEGVIQGRLASIVAPVAKL